MCCVPALARDKLMILDGTESEITLRISQNSSMEYFCMKSALLEQIFFRNIVLMQQGKKKSILLHYIKSLF